MYSEQSNKKAATYNTGYLQLDSLHRMFYREMGNPNGIPIVYVHGGPGGGHSPECAKHFDPDAFRIILYDQRGAGFSTPYAETKDNSPDHLVADLETLRTHLGIEQWHVFGASWGSTLGLLYAEDHPDHVSSLTLSGVFMMRQQEIDWFVHGMGLVYPETQEAFIKFLSPVERKDPLRSYFNRLVHADPAIHLRAAKAWADHEIACVDLSARPTRFSGYTPQELLALSRLEAHFMLNHRFTPDDRILAHAHKIAHIPTMIVQGRFDVVCPPQSAYDLKQALPNARLQFALSGHSSMNQDLEDKLRLATDRIRDIGTPIPSFMP